MLTLTLTGGVTPLSVEERKRIYNSFPEKKNLNPEKFAYLKQKDCVRVTQIPEKVVNAILDGESEPSRTTQIKYSLRKTHTNKYGKKKQIFNKKAWLSMTPYSRLMIFFEDHAIDANAVSHHVEFLN